jgi:hypothetical protein
MKTFKQLISAVTLSILASTAVAQTEEISGNLVPLPGHSTANGLTVNQAYAVNQALSAAGAGVIISGFNYGYQYNLGNSWSQCTAFNQDGSCSWTMTFNPRVDVNVSIRDNNNAQIYGTTHIETGVNTGDRSRDFQYRFNDPRDILTLGNFNYSASTSNNSRIWGMYSQAVYTVNPCVSNPQSSPSCPGYKTFYNISDDSHAIVPIPFGFPLYGQVFTHSIFFDNGAVSFYTPGNANHPQRWGGGGLSMPSLSESMSSSFFYTIVPLKTDLIANGGRHFTQGDSNYLRYTWEDVSQFGRWDSRNTFSLEIRPTGYIGLQYDQIDIQGSWTSAIIGNASLGEYQTIQNNTSTTTTAINSWSISDTTATDCSNPLNHPNCPGYAQAYFDQQCSINALYSTSCPGYAQAYFDQQCTISALYDPSCPGYATAYYDYQCSLDPLYHTGCPGHAQAYFDQQCSLDPLYDEACPGYAQAYFDQQCSLDPLYDESCPLYADAFYVQQCTLDPLYDSGCTGYAEAFAKKYILTTPAAEPVTVAAVSESDEIVETTAVSEAPAATADPSDTTAPVQLVENTAPAPQPAAAPALRTEAAAASPAPRTTRQALAERRLAAARAQTEQRARENPAAVASEMDSADSMEQQVELQNVVLGAMSFVPGFDAYGRATVPDAAGYPPFVIYPGQHNIDSPAARGLLGRSDRLHQEMVDAQYR